MKKFKNLTGKGKADYIIKCTLYPFKLLFAQLGKIVHLLKFKKKNIIACMLVLIIFISELPLNNFVANAEEAIVYGDVNRDSKVNQEDVSDLKKFLTEYMIDIDKKAADVNVDNTIDLHDLLLLKQYVEGLNVVLGEAVTVTFHTNGGSTVAPIKICKGATFASAVDKVPVTEKSGYVFAGWVTDNNEPFYSEDAILENVNVYAAFEKMPEQESLNVTSFSLEDQSPDISFTVVSGKAMSASEVKSGLTLLAMDGSDPVELEVIIDTDTQFTVKAVNGFNEGASYQLTLADGLMFKDKESTIRTSNFTINKQEVNNLSFNDDIIYIKDTDSMSYTLNDSDIAIPVLDAAVLSTDAADAVEGYFNYTESTLAVGNILCIYENTHPSSRDYVNNNYEDDSMAYIEVTAVSGSKISFKSINEENSEKVFFMPDTIPYSTETLPTGSSGTVDATSYDNLAWGTMGYSGTPEFNVGDFVVFYNGAFSDMKEDTPVYYGEVTAVEDNNISYKKTTAEAMESSQDLFLKNPVDTDELLENIDTDSLEQQVEQQALKSGFAAKAASYLATAAQETDGFQNLNLENVSMKTASGQTLTANQMKSIGGSWELGDDVNVTAKIGKSSKYFSDGVSLSLRIDAEFTVDLGEDGEMKIVLSATFVEEIAVDVNINAQAKVTWIIFIPIFKSLRFGAAVDIKNYSAISIDVKIYTVEKEEEGFWEKLKGYNSNFKEQLDKIEELKDKISEAKETADKIKGYKEDLENMWSTLSKTTNGELTQANYETILEALGELNVTNEMMDLLHLTDDEEIEAGVQDLMERYSEMLETESDWITLVEKEILSQDIHIFVFAIGIDVDFVIKANVNIALGANMEYVVGKRYSFWMDIINKTSGSTTMDLLDERFAFQFYVMGSIGLKMGIKAELKVGIISTKIGSIGISTEFGPYVKLWGYFIYEYSKMRPANTSAWIYDERKMGALYLEFGLYLEVAFNAQVLDGLFSYNPTLLDKEFPLLTAGNRKNYYDFGYELDSDESVLVLDEDKNSNNGITMMLPESYRMMQYIDLVEGNIEQDVGDYSRFIVTLSNKNFNLNTETGLITVNVPKNVQYMECDLTLTWKMGKLEFSSRDISMTIPLVWTTLSTEELNQKYTASVKVGNAVDGYATVWSERVKKNALFDLPSHEEILTLIGYNNYMNGIDNLKYQSIAGYGGQQTTDLTVYTDATYYFDVTPKEYTLKINGVQDKDGNIGTKEFIANYGEKFDLTELLSSGANNTANGDFTNYLKTEATYNGSVINQDITRVIDNQFAKQILNGVDYTAKYTDNSATATFKFVGEGVSIKDKTVKIKKGTTPPDIFSDELAAQNIMIKGISPVLGNIMSDTEFTVSCKIYVAPKFLVTYHTNEGSAIEAKEFQEGSMMLAPADPTRAGYRFEGWYTDEALNIPYDFDGAIMPGNDLELYAKWSGNLYHVNFDANEGNLPAGTQNPVAVTYGGTYGTLPTPTRTAYQFLGWYTERSGGTKITENTNITALKDIVLYAHWGEKQIINESIISFTTGQSHVYNRQVQPFVFSTGSIPSSSFAVWYKRQGLDSEYTKDAVNAGTYDIKFVRQEDNNYKYFETVLKGVYTITKADSKVLSLPTGTAYYGNIIADKMVSDVDYIGDGQLQYAASSYNTSTYEEPYVVSYGPPVVIGKRSVVRNANWVNSSVVYNLYDSGDFGNSAYLWVRLAEGENYKASEIKISTNPIQIINKPRSILNGMGGLTYKLTIKTSDVDKAGTNSYIYAGIGNAALQHLDNSGNDFEKGDEDEYSMNIDGASLYNTCYGTIPLTLKYDKDGLSAGWHCGWVRLDVYKNGQLLIRGNQYNVNHWFGAEDYDSDIIVETYNLTGYERNITSWGTFLNETNTISLNPTSSDYSWKWLVESKGTPAIHDQYSAVGNTINLSNAYNPYVFLNAPELSVSFNNNKYNKFINQSISEFNLDSKELYQAMVKDGTGSLTLDITLEFKPVNGNYSIAQSCRKRTHTITVTCDDAMRLNAASSRSAYTLSRSAKQLLGLNSGQLANVNAVTKPGANGTFEVSYSINENSGIWGTKFAVDYDKTKVELQGYSLGNVFSDSEVMPPEQFDNGRYVFFANRSDFNDTTKIGKLVTLTFKIKDDEELTDYPVTLDTTAMQSINAESGMVSTQLAESAPSISVSAGNTDTIKNQDKVMIVASAGTSTVASVEVKRDNGTYSDITESYQNGYIVTKSGTYTFKITTSSGESATTAINYSKIDSAKPVISVNAGGYSSGAWTKKEDVTLSVSNITQNLGTTEYFYKIGTGEWKSYNAPIVAEKTEGEIIYSFMATSEAGIDSDIVTFVVKRDNILPSGTISIDNNNWSKFLNTITFGLSFNKTKVVTVKSSDNESGVAKTEYYLSNGKVDDITAITNWKECNGSFSINPSNRYVIYVRITDHMSNSVIINSDGITVENIMPTITEKIDKVAPFIKAGKNSEWIQGSDKTLTFTSNAEIQDFISVTIDGKVVDRKNYNLREGSTIVELKSDYLATLSAGEHTLNINSTTGTASTDFMITTKPNDTTKPNASKSPKTGERDNTLLLASLMFISGNIVIIFGMLRKRKKVADK